MAEINLGDKVKFLNEVGGGVVVELIDKHMVKIRTSDDWDIPALKSELLVTEPAVEKPTQTFAEPQKSNKKKKEETSKKEEKPAAETPPTALEIDKKTEIKDSPKYFLLSLLPENTNDPLNSPLEAYLINDSEYFVLYNYSIVYDGAYLHREAGILEENTKYLMESYPREKLNNITEVLIQLIYYQRGNYQPHPPIEKRIKLDTKKFYKEGSFKENDFFDEPALIFPVFDSMKDKIEKVNPKEIEKAMLQKKSDRPRKAPVKTDYPDKEMVVDLHIHELLDDHSNMSNVEILEVQLDHFRKAMDEAIKTRKRKIIFVHGVGQGTLKQDIRGELDRDFKAFEYQDASFKEYGYGATLVHIRQNFKPRRRR